MARCLCINPDGKIWIEDVKGYLGFRRIIGGYLEAIRLPRADLSAFIDEQGKLHDLKYNPVATMLAMACGFRFNYGDQGIVGPMIVVGPPDENGEETSIPEDKINKLMNMVCKIASDIGIGIPQ